ncbi:hypothetical protein [Corynebacterium cystitidis]|uniref:hypothetical protein n=1 Tax=Corynebacterium cystitidis TaxID=35757 RepID=UPI00211F3021|nr:hypothetical protein [Corynebacterium cystitidis]
MKISFTSKKNLAALAMLLPLTLTACGSNKSDEAAADATSSSTATSSASEAADKGKDKDKDKDGEKPEGEQAADGQDPNNPDADPNNPGAARAGTPRAAGGAAPNVGNPLEGSQLPTVQLEPLETGHAGTAEDAAQIRANLDEIYNQTTVQGWTNALANNTCSRVIEENGGAQVFDLGGQDMSLAEVGLDMSQMGVEDVRDVKVDGDRASVTVVVRTQNGTDSATQIFQKEGGRWKMCN